MAEFLKRQNDIVTLKVTLQTDGEVACILQFHEASELTSLEVWRGPLEAFGLSGAMAGGRVNGGQAYFPQPLQEAVERDWQLYGYNHDCLWVHLVQPCGNLHLAPWEQLLTSPETSVLMLPDFIFPPPQESFEQLDVVVCGSAPLPSERADATNDLIDTLQAIAKGVDHPLRLHLFTDADLSPLLASLSFECEVIQHSPSSANLPAANESATGWQPGKALRSPWLLWMREALKPYSVDVVHFVCHGYLSGGHGSLLFAKSPTRRDDDYLSGSVGAAELSNFLTQIGAWASAFSAPTENHSRSGLKTLAEEIGQTLPGPMLMFDSAKGSYDVLTDAYRFIHSSYPQTPPRHYGSLYLYCQPYLLKRSVHTRDNARLNSDIGNLVARYSRNDAQAASALQAFALDDSEHGDSLPPKNQSTSPLVAATERVAERVQLQYQQLLRDQVVPEEMALRDLSIAMETIQQFRLAVSQIEQRRISKEVNWQLDQIERDTRHVGNRHVLLSGGRGLSEIKLYLNRIGSSLAGPDAWQQPLSLRISKIESSLRRQLGYMKNLETTRKIAARLKDRSDSNKSLPSPTASQKSQDDKGSKDQ